MELEADAVRRAIYDAEHRATTAEAKAIALEAELRTVKRWVWVGVAGIVLVAIVALIVLGAVAFNAVGEVS